MADPTAESNSRATQTEDDQQEIKATLKEILELLRSQLPEPKVAEPEVSYIL